MAIDDLDIPDPDTISAAVRTGARVLVADDNPVNREMALRMLEQLGYHADTVADGIEALAAHRAAPYDLILMDCDMPQLDGYAATMRLREEESGMRTPVLALTSHGGAAQDEKCRRAGMDGLLSKPVRPQMLREALTRWLDGRAIPAAKSRQPASPADELEAVHAMFGSDFAELAALYQRDSPPRIATLWQAQERADRTLLGKVAHVLGGSSASIGAITLAAQCKELELELRANAGALEDVNERLANIENEYRRISGKLHALLNG